MRLVAPGWEGTHSDSCSGYIRGREAEYSREFALLTRRRADLRAPVPVHDMFVALEVAALAAK